MKWVALLLVAVAGLGVAADRAWSPPDPLEGCADGAYSPGGLYEESDPGAPTADAAVAGFLDRADHHTSESSSDGGVVTYRTYDADDRPLFVVDAEHRLPRGWFVGRTVTC